MHRVYPQVRVWVMTASALRGVLLVSASLGVTLGALGCTVEAGERPPDPWAAWSHTLPGDPTPLLGPSMARLRAGAPHEAPMFLDDVDTCAGCHAEIASEWRSSAHAFSSFNNPFYRFNIDHFRASQPLESTQHCAGCHDVALLFDGAMPQEVKAQDWRAHMGVTCNTCHSVEGATMDGNGSYTLTDAEIPLPTKGDAASLADHAARVSLPTLKTNALCVSCHRGFLGPHVGNTAFIPGLTEPMEWARSPQAGGGLMRIDDPMPAGAQNCVSCHMPQVSDGAKTWRAHTFPGSHTSLAAARGDDVTLKRLQDFLDGVASIDVAAASLSTDLTLTTPAEVFVPGPDQTVILDVVVRNLRAAHRFPGGARDLQDTWIELEVLDRHGARLAEAGLDHAASGADPTAHVLVVTQLDDQGQPVRQHETERFRAPLTDTTIPARDAAVIQYSFHTPADLTPDRLPLQVTAKLRHRSHPLDFLRAVCDAASGPRTQAFIQAGDRLGRPAPSPCFEPPITEIAQVTIPLGVAQPLDGRPLWRRRYDHGIGWLKQLQERVGAVRPSLEAALAEARDLSDPRAQAMVMTLLATLEIRQGRTQAALDWLDQADALVPNHPATHYLRGDALSQVWRWCEAVEPYRRSLEAYPAGDDLSWSGFARALSSCGLHQEALDAAAKGLKTRPRHTGLLLTQSMALASLKAPADLLTASRAAYAASRFDDMAQSYRITCTQTVEGCERIYQPIPIYPMRAP
jgi:hypothetical protein